MVSTKQKRELLGLALLALTAFLVLSLVPVWWLGGAGAGPFGSGNLMGPLGATLAGTGYRVFGIALPILPALAGLGGAACFGWMATPALVRWAAALVGLAVVIPGLAALLTPEFAPGLALLPAAAAGWIGVTLATPLTALLGWLGTALVLVFIVLVIPVATVGWNPGAIFGRALVRLARWISTWIRRRWQERATARGDAPEPAVGGVAIDPASVAGAAELVPMPVEAPARRARGARRAAESPAELEDPGDPDATERPGPELLDTPPARDMTLSERELDRLGDILMDTLRTFKVDGRIIGRTTGPVVTQFEVVPAPGIKVNRIAALDADLALALKAASVRIVAPIPGKGAVGVDVPNPEPEVVHLREVLESPAFQRSRGQLPLALGKDLHGRPYVADLARMPHLLIAGATGSGKSVCINTLITSLIFRHSPRTLRLLMIDPKMVELSMYADLPHLRHPVVTDPRDAAAVLKWAVLEMERRYALLSENGARSLAEFNRRAGEGQPLRRPPSPADPEGRAEDREYTDGPLPYIVLVVDELADLILSAQAEIERPLAQLAQKARAIGIHLIVATQRPSVNVITGLIKANFPCRIAFRVSSKVDSRTILDQNGADALLGNGDMLFLPPGRSDPVRIQGVFLSTEETERLMNWYRERAGEEAPVEEDILEVVREQEALAGDGVADDQPDDRDPLFVQAAEVCIQFQQGSTSLLQRRLRIGYGRAARIIDQLHHAGILGPPDGSKPREVLVGLEALDHIIQG